MKKGEWLIASSVKGHEQELCKKGWEPFAVAYDPHPQVMIVFLKKFVPSKRRKK